MAYTPQPNTFKPKTTPPPTMDANPFTPPPTPTASSVGGTGFGTAPDIPADKQQWVSDMLAGLMYSVPAGGYVSRLNPRTGAPPSQEDMMNANSWYNKFGPGGANTAEIKYNLQDPAANQRARELYSYLGDLPTRAVGTAALEKLYASEGGAPAATGPSINQQLGSAGPWQGPWAILPERPSSTPRYGYNF